MNTDNHNHASTPSVQPGIYRHFKGSRYEVIGTAKNSETLEEMVIYRALYGDGEVWVRPTSMWTETVERDGKIFTRFVKEEAALGDSHH